MKPIKINNKAMLLAIDSGNNYIQINGRRFLLLEVEKSEESTQAKDMYVVTNAEEERLLLSALKENNPILSEKEIAEILGD